MHSVWFAKQTLPTQYTQDSFRL